MQKKNCKIYIEKVLVIKVWLNEKISIITLKKKNLGFWRGQVFQVIHSNLT